MLPKFLKNLRKRVSLESVQENLKFPAMLQETCPKLFNRIILDHN